MSLINGSRQSCAVVPVSSPSQEGFDCFVLVCENLEWDNPTWEFLKEPIKAAAKVDKAVGMDTLLFPCKETSMVDINFFFFFQFSLKLP